MKEWYLIDRPSTNSGGFENEVFNNYKSDAMYDILDTELAVDVQLCSPDLSERTDIRCVIQGNTGNTYLSSMQRSILAPIGTLKAGYYIYYEGDYWLLVGRPGNNKVYEKSIAYQCQFKLKWQKSSGEVVERWANFTSASKYDVGETGNYTVYVTSNNYTILMPNDDDSETIDGRRVFIDISKTPNKVFKITRDDDVLLNYHDHGGIFTYIADKTEFDPNKDNQELGICDYFEPFNAPITEDDPPIVTINITCKGNKSLVAGGNYKTFTALFYASDGQDVDERSMNWVVTCLPENESYIHYEILPDQKIRIKADYNEAIIGTKIKLTANLYNDSESIYIEIGGGI